MQNLEWNDKTDKKSEIEAKDVNSLANAIITIIDWINSNGNNGDIDLTDYVKKEAGKGLSTIKNLHTSVMTSDVETDYTELYYEDQEGNPYIAEFYNKWQIKNNYYTKAEVEAYIEETLLGGAW